MAIKSADQISIIDVTDAYSVMLTSDAYTFPGDYSAAVANSQCTTQVVAMRGAEIMTSKVGTITAPTGITATVSNNETASPTITIKVTGSVTAGGVIEIPVTIDGVTINKEFSYAVAFKGNGIKGKTVHYAAYDTGDASDVPDTEDWSTTMPTVAAGQYLWTRTVISYDDGSTTTSYSISRKGVGVKSTVVTYAVGTSGTTAPSSGWGSAIPAVDPGKYLWTKTVITYDDDETSESYSVGMMGATGPQGIQGNPGADAITMTVTSSNGTIFKNSSIATTLTAHVYKAGKELSSTEIQALGTIKWYKDGGSTAVGTGATLTISAGSVDNKATYVAQLEG